MADENEDIATGSETGDSKVDYRQRAGDVGLNVNVPDYQLSNVQMQVLKDKNQYLSTGNINKPQ